MSQYIGSSKCQPMKHLVAVTTLMQIRLTVLYSSAANMLLPVRVFIMVVCYSVHDLCNDVMFYSCVGACIQAKINKFLTGMPYLQTVDSIQ